MSENKKELRQNELDWLRVFAFGLLIPFHTIIGFLPHNIYPYENNHLLGEFASLPIALIHLWRLPLLFIISGMGIYFAVNKLTWKQLIKERTKRLLIPLITITILGVLLNIYLRNFLGYNQISLVTYFGHLWFVISLSIYSAICIPLFYIIKKRSDGKTLGIIKKIIGMPKGIGILFIMPIPLVLIEILMKPWARGFIGTGYEFPWYLLFFILGYTCMSAKDQFWEMMDKIRNISLASAIILNFLIVGIIIISEDISLGYSSLILDGGWMLFGGAYLDKLTASACIIHGLNSWNNCIVFFSWGKKYLNKPNKIITYLNNGVYTQYIIHMPIILVTLYYLKDIELFWGMKFIIINVTTIIGCLTFFETMKLNKITRTLFGIKSKTITAK